MKIKKNYKIVLIIFFSGLLGIIFYKLLMSGSVLSEQDAFAMIYGNYDMMHQKSIWKYMNLSRQKRDSYWDKKTGIVTKIFFQRYKENGHKKIFLLTKTVPIDFPFECHACLPLLSATVFSRDHGKWKIEAQNLFLMFAGEYGMPPKTRLISVGKNSHGLLLEFEHHGGGTSKEIVIIIPFKKDILNAYQETIYYENFSDCGWSLQCAAFTTNVEFNKLKSNGDYYQLNVKKFGTDTDEKQDFKAVPIEEEIVYRFLDGKYVQISKKAYPKIEYNF